MVAAVTSGAGFSQQFVDLLIWEEKTGSKSSCVKLLMFRLAIHCNGSSTRMFWFFSDL